MSSHFGPSKRFSNGFTSHTNVPSQELPTSFYDPGTTNGASRHLQRQSVNLDELRAGLTRRNTTSNQSAAFGFTNIGQQSRVGQERPRSGQYSFPQLRNDSSQVIDRKQQEYENIRQKQARFKAEMEYLAQEEEALRRDLYDAGHQSEPTTPPEPQDTGFPTALSRPNRYSSSSIISPPSYSTRSSRAGSQVTSPPNGRDRALQALNGYPSYSMPGSRGDSDEEEHDRYDGEVLSFDHKKAAALNRNSMPVTRRDLGTRNTLTDSTTFGHLDTTSFLFDDENKMSDQTTPVPGKTFPTYLQMQTTQDNFPTLRPVGRPSEPTPSSNALDLAHSRTSDVGSNNGGWPSFTSNRQSMPLPSSHAATDSIAAFLPPPASSGSTTPSKPSTGNRHSMNAMIAPHADSKRPGLLSSPPTSTNSTKSGSSFSTSSVPTMATVGNGTPVKSPANASAEQRLHQHNLSLGRIPANAMSSNRHSREYPSPESTRSEEQHSNMASLSSILQAGAPSFGPGSVGLSSPESRTSSIQQNVNAFNSNSQAQMSANNFTSPQTLSALMGTMQLQSPQNQYTAPADLAESVGYNPFQQMPPQRLPDNQTRVMQQRRTQNGEGDAARFGNVELASLQGEIYSLCKDQHGCRYLQKRLEERKPEYVEIIFRETCDHMIELMTDPFGNYLCQKLLEHSNEDQRTVLIESAAPNMVDIALNQHGTRALQKMIEFVSTSEQINTVTIALRNHVVRMIQDLNGNHVIQKCLNRLSSQHIQFIVDAVSANCVIVGTHRHGCCVIQRCVDHADGQQKSQLVQAITNCSMELVQDPFGNYVLQYIFDLDQKSFSQPMCETFLGSVARLSKQKFSSNVIEKCLRVADTETKHAMIQEMINAPNFASIVDDNYANYVLQTAMEQATEDDENQLVERLRPILPGLRHKPHGRRYQTKINERDRRLGISTSGTITPSEMSSPEPSVYATPYNRLHDHTQQAFNNLSNNLGNNYGNFGTYQYPNPLQYQTAQFQNPAQFQNLGQYQAPNQYQNTGYGFGAGQPHRMSNPPFPNFNPYQQANVQQHQPYSQFSRAQQNGGNYY